MLLILQPNLPDVLVYLWDYFLLHYCSDLAIPFELRWLADGHKCASLHIDCPYQFLGLAQRGFLAWENSLLPAVVVILAGSFEDHYRKFRKYKLSIYQSSKFYIFLIFSYSLCILDISWNYLTGLIKYSSCYLNNYYGS